MLDRYWTERQEDLPLESPYDALILASIIEKETAIDSSVTVLQVYLLIA